MSTIIVDPRSADPPFEQVRRQIAAGASSGVLPPGHKLPTVRQLAADLGLAVNTVARAYRELESEGLIETHGRRGTFVASHRPHDPEAAEAAAAFVEIARRAGLSRPEALRLVDDAWTR